MEIKYQPQLHKCGCVVACAAMILGKPYMEVHDDISPWLGKWVDSKWVQGNHSFAEDGWYIEDGARYIEEHGFASQVAYFTQLGHYERKVWPPEPWAEVHMAQVLMPSGNTHGIVMLADGTLYDPVNPPGTYPGNWSFYQKVWNVYGFWKVGGACPRTELLWKRN
jgi:hypothetical protein